jgi:hypothetical protein
VNGNVGLVVGATWPEELERVRAICPDQTILIPGIGSQGGDMAAALAAALDSGGGGVIVSASRQVLYASTGDDFARPPRGREGAAGPDQPGAGCAAGQTLAMVMEVRLGDIVRLRKVHPCGSYDWEVVRLGADIGIRCRTCGRRVLLERRVFEKRVREFLARGEPEGSESQT